jgi:hypothetical protein
MVGSMAETGCFHAVAQLHSTYSPTGEEHERKVAVVALRDARGHHAAVVVEPRHAVPALAAVRGPGRAPDVARGAVANRAPSFF